MLLKTNRFFSINIGTIEFHWFLKQHKTKNPSKSKKAIHINQKTDRVLQLKIYKETELSTKGRSLASFRNINQRYHPKERGREKRPLWWQFRLKLICPLAEIQKVFALDFSSPPQGSCFLPGHTLTLSWAVGARQPTPGIDTSRSGTARNRHSGHSMGCAEP